jgi:hypothetical protein
MKIKGTVTHVPLSGGFWAILGDNGRRYRPVDPLPEDFCQEGYRIFANVEPVQTFSIFMWGTDVELKSIEKLEI